MKLYVCSKCNNPLHFENTSCLKCKSQLGFDASKLQLVTLAKTRVPGIFKDIRSGRNRYRFCANAEHGVCNWLLPADDESEFCCACVLNRTIPPLTPENLLLWQRIEFAKHRLIYSLFRLRLPVAHSPDSEAPRLAFDFLAELAPDQKVMTGHQNGLITLNIAEADEAHRVKSKLDMGEKYRTLLGHFRHEVGHYYWDLLIRNSPDHAEFRVLFGDESQRYDEALKLYYEHGAPADWRENFISPYASAHPWEDWAESWSHYLHMLDTLETAYYFGIAVSPLKSAAGELMRAEIDRDPYRVKEFEAVLSMWLPITFAVNSLNRSMGHADFYPFVIAPAVVAKMKFIHNICSRMP